MGLTWHQACAAWNKLDAARLAGRLPMVEYLVIRADADPDRRWRTRGEGGQAVHDLVPFLFGRQRGHDSRKGGSGDAAKAWGLAHGFKGQVGGWIYRARDLEHEAEVGTATRRDARSGRGYRARPVGQGWYSTVIAGNRHNSRIVLHQGRYYWNDLDLLAQEQEAVA